MNWMQQIDGYCERVGFAFWAEPLNAITNAAFVIAAIIMWRRTAGLPVGRALSALLGVIGLGSFLFHTFATQWASLADVTPIGMFILFYLFVVNRAYVGLPVWAALGMSALFAPFAAILVPLLNKLPFFHISDFYWTVPILLVGYGLFLRPRAPETAAGLFIGAAILSLSITVRSFDTLTCAQWPLGTHFAWHCLNAVMLAWMIDVYRRHMVAGAGLAR